MLVDLVEGAAALAERSPARADAAARRQPADARARDRRGLRRAARRDRRDAARCSTGSRPSGTRSRASSTRRPGGGGVSDGGPRRDLRPRLPGLRGRAHEPLARAAARSGATASASRSGSAAARRAKIAPWLLIALALAPMAVLVVLAAFLGSVADQLRRLLAAVVRRVLRVRDRAARALRGRRRAAAALPRPPRRRALAVRRAADHADGLRRVALVGVPDRGRRRRLAARGGAVRLEPARRAATPARGSATTGTSCRASSRRGSCSPSS